jgi:hypothetical protein
VDDYIRFYEMDKEDKSTFLYMRNGDSYYRLSTAIDFGSQLFPDDARSYLMGGKMWVQEWGREIITDSEHTHKVESRKLDEKEHEERLAAWERLPEEEKAETFEPWYRGDIRETYIPLTPETVYYDDGMAQIEEETRHHNRIAVVLQGLLDRSPVFHPHPPWRLWTPEGFTAGIELHHDETRAMVDGDPPDFEAYREELNKSIKKGTNTIGQQDAWERAEARKENDRQARDWRIRSSIPYKHYKPYGNPGPGLVAEVVKMSRDKTKCSFEWWRERMNYSRYDNSNIRARFRCSVSRLLNVDAYKPGDFKQFYADPRTRADYLKWAPLLLAAEDFHGAKSSGE